MLKYKVAKIITTSFCPRVVRESAELTGNPLGYFSHSQKFTTPESIIDLIKLNIEKELSCDPGADVDLIIVNNDTGWKLGRSYLDGIDNIKLPRGIVRIFHRENYGRSFGGYNFAFEKLRTEYDYFIFTEDDILLTKDNYALLGIESFEKINNCGFVAYQSLTDKSFLNLSKEDTLHAHGGVGLSSTKVLTNLYKKSGNLPYAIQETSQDYEDIIRYGEVNFTNKISKLGYRLINIPSDTKLYSFAYDEMRGITVERYATFYEKMQYFIKLYLYKIPYIRAIFRRLS